MWARSETKVFATRQLQFGDFYSLVKLFEWIHGAISLVERDLWLVFEGNIIVRLFSEPFSVSSEAIVFLVNC